MPDFLSLPIAIDNSVKNQTYNTPAIGDADPARRADRLDARQRRSGLVRRAHRRLVVAYLYGWAEALAVRHAVRHRPGRSARWSSARSTLDESIDAAAVAKTLRANGIVDIEPYRKLGRNQLRVGMFPAIDPADVQALTACIDWVVECQTGGDAA